MAQIIPPNVLQEQTVIVGPQYAERLIHHNPPPRSSVSAPAQAESCLAEQRSGLHRQTSRLRIIPYWFAGI